MTIATLILTTLLAQTVTLDVRGMDINAFFRQIANLANMNIVLHPSVQGTVNLMVKDAPWEEVLDSVMKNYGLGKEVEGNTMRIAPLAVLEAQRKQATAAEEARVNALPLRTQVYFLKYASAEDIGYIMSNMVSPRGSVIVYTPANAVIVRDVEPEPSR
jgi:type IV pilus assembly protein PilQ